MVVNMIKWRPWLASSSRCFQVKLKLHRLEGASFLVGAKSSELGILPSASKNSGELNSIVVNVKWKGPRGALGPRFKRSLKRAKTNPKAHEDGCDVAWEEEFEHTCFLTVTKDGQYLPWDVYFVIKQVNARSKSLVLGTASLNVSNFAPTVENAKQTAKVPILTPSGVQCPAVLVVSADFVELRTHENTGFDYPILSCIGGPMLCNADEQLVDVMAERQRSTKGLFTVTKREGNDMELSPKAEVISDSSRDSVDSDSTFGSEDEEGMDPSDMHVNGYGQLSGVNLVVEGALPGCNENRCAADDVVASPCKKSSKEFLDGGDSVVVSGPDLNGTLSVFADPASMSSSMRSLLGWRKRKLNYRSPKWRGEPLLKKDYGEEGGDDIDFDRRFTSISAKTPLAEIEAVTSSYTVPQCLDFGDDQFAVGSWERKDFVSRDGRMKLEGHVFFATIDQRSERAAGEGACTALVAVISAWLHQNPDRMPIKAELDTLIREGSAEWRTLCNREPYRELFPDGHFDLETVINARIRPLVELPEKSYIGFFQLNRIGDSCDYLQGAMSFDNMWEEIMAKQEEHGHPAMYVVSWNDHFFIVKIEKEVCYIIDTLGERLLEGGNQAYILRFDQETRLSHVPSVEAKESPNSLTSPDEKSTKSTLQANAEDPMEVNVSGDEGPVGLLPACMASSEIVHTGREACKEFIKGFFAALPLQELERDIRKGLHGNTLYQRLQIEFHYTALVASE